MVQTPSKRVTGSVACAAPIVNSRPHTPRHRSAFRMRQTSGLPVVLGLTAFWVGLIIAAHHYPGGYDWQYTTISSLVYAERNPNGFLWARGGMALCGVCGLYWTARVLPNTGQRGLTDPAGIWILGLGYLCMTCCALFPEQSLRVPRGHDSLALAAFLSLCIGTVLSTFPRVMRSAGLRPLPGARYVQAVILAGAALSPVVLAALAQAYVSRALPSLPWINPVWRARGVPMYLSFAFWEWVTCGVLSLYLVFLSRAALR